MQTVGEKTPSKKERKKKSSLRCLLNLLPRKASLFFFILMAVLNGYIDVCRWSLTTALSVCASLMATINCAGVSLSAQRFFFFVLAVFLIKAELSIFSSTHIPAQ